jgi:hypothetical protein
MTGDFQFPWVFSFGSYQACIYVHAIFVEQI